MIAAVRGNITDQRVNFAGCRPATKSLAATATWATALSTNLCSMPVLPIAVVLLRSRPQNAFNEPRTHTASDKIPIASDAPLRPTSRGFLHWRFADAGPEGVPPSSWAGVRKPSHNRDSCTAGNLNAQQRGVVQRIRAGGKSLPARTIRTLPTLQCQGHTVIDPGSLPGRSARCRAD